jgi:thiol-disulfide isomerase/thioredoxin
MRILFILICMCFSFFMSAQSIQQLSFSEFQKNLNSIHDSVIVINFWATWCKPCIEELPGFEKLNENYSAKKVKVILVNLDFNSKIKSLAEPFVKNKKLQSTLWHITDTDPNAWINKVDSTWSGAIPATIIFNPSHEKIKFTEGQMTFDELEKILKPYVVQ